MTPQQLSSWLASFITWVISASVLTVALYTTLQGRLPEAFSVSAISAARLSTVSSTSGPYRNWLPTTNQNSHFFISMGK